MISNSATKFLLLLLLSPTPLAATTLIPHKPPARLLAQAPPTTPLQALSAIIIVAAQCRPGESTCNAGCMPPRSECCPDGLGYCKQGYACVVDGCCPIGHTAATKSPATWARCPAARSCACLRGLSAARMGDIAMLGRSVSRMGSRSIVRRLAITEARRRGLPGLVLSRRVRRRLETRARLRRGP